MAIYTNYTPNFKCTTDGNGYGELELKAGLITYDEVIFAGGYFNKNNNNYYLYDIYSGGTGIDYFWTMSPAGTSSTNLASLWSWDSWGAVYTSNVKYPLLNTSFYTYNPSTDVLSGTGTTNLYEGSLYHYSRLLRRNCRR